MKKYIKRRISLIFLTLILILLCVNCGQKPRLMFEGISEIDYSEWKIGKPGGSMTISHETDPKSFNVIIANESSTRDVMNRVDAIPGQGMESIGRRTFGRLYHT